MFGGYWINYVLSWLIFFLIKVLFSSARIIGDYDKLTGASTEGECLWGPQPVRFNISRFAVFLLCFELVLLCVGIYVCPIDKIGILYP